MAQEDYRQIVFLRRDKTTYGGAENYLARLSAELRRQGIRHRVMTSRLPRFLPSVMRVLGYALAACLSKRQQFYFSLERLPCADIYRAGDGVHREFLRSKRHSRRRLLDALYLYLERRCFSNAMRIIANSRMVKQDIMRHYRVADDKIDVIYNGIELDIGEVGGASLRDEYALDPACRIILFVGSGFARKGVTEMLHLLARLERPFFAIIVGKDRRQREYQQLCVELGLAGRVVFTGPRSDIERYYRDSDIFLLPTRYEPSSNAVLEAMRGGNAVITTRQNGAAELLPDELIMASSEDQEILPILARLLTDDVFLDQHKQHNRKVVQQYSIQENTRQTLQVIQQVRDAR